MSAFRGQNLKLHLIMIHDVGAIKYAHQMEKFRIKKII